MNKLLKESRDVPVLASMDNILIYLGDIHSHVIQVSQVLKKRKDAGVNLKASKFHFHTDQVKYLISIYSQKGVFMDPKKVQAVTNWPALANIHDVRCFISFANFYHNFIRSYTNICKPLFAPLKNVVMFVFNDKTQSAVHPFKTAFTSAPIARHFDPCSKSQ